MSRILIVDDEQVERDGLEAILKSQFNQHEFMQAENGRRAIELANEWLPDLVLMDIRMPGINGLEAIETISAAHPQMKFVMITAFDTFDYARKALRLKVKDYILKPSKADVIIDKVNEILREITIEHDEVAQHQQLEDRLDRLLPIAQTDLVTQLLFDHVHDVHLDEMLGLVGGSSNREALVMTLMMNTRDGLHLDKQVLERWYAAVKEQLQSSIYGWIGAMTGRQIPLIVFREENKSLRSQALVMVRTISNLLQRFPELECFIGIGNAYPSLEHIRLSYQEALLASVDMSLPTKHRFYSDSLNASEFEQEQHARQLEKQVMDDVRFGNWEQVQVRIIGLIEHYEKCGASVMISLQRALEAMWITYRMLQELGIESERPVYSFQVSHYRQLRTETISMLEKMMRSAITMKENVKPDIVHQIKQYIMENSSKDISLEMIADRVNLSPYYISKLFKEQLGLNYIDYLTECRIERAKSLMCDSELSLKEITFEIGYNDPNYFSRVFRRVYGISPTEYRKRIFNNKVQVNDKK
ncbi:MAG: response regulator [Paenibacillaceae bacterium]